MVVSPGPDPDHSESLKEAERRAAELEADLQKSGKYGQFLLQRVEELEEENRILREQASSASACGSEGRGTTPQFRGRVDSSEGEEEEDAGTVEAPQHKPKRRDRLDPRLSDVLKQNEELTDHLRQLEHDRQTLRKHNEELKLRIARDTDADVERKAMHEKQYIQEASKKDDSWKRRVLSKIKEEALVKSHESERQQLQAQLHQLQQSEARACAKSAGLHEQLRAVLVEAQEGRALLEQTQHLLSERTCEVEALRGKAEQLQAALEESCMQRERDGAPCSLAAEMAARPSIADEAEDEDDERQRLFFRVQELEQQHAQAEATITSLCQQLANLQETPGQLESPGRLETPNQQPVTEPTLVRAQKPSVQKASAQPLLPGAIDPLNAGIQQRQKEDRKEVLTWLHTGMVASSGRRATVESYVPEKDLQRLLGNLQQRNVELLHESECIRNVAATAQRWERRLLLVILVLLAVLLTVALRASF